MHAVVPRISAEILERSMDDAMWLHGLVFLASQSGSHLPCQATLFLICERISTLALISAH